MPIGRVGWYDPAHASTRVRHITLIARDHVDMCVCDSLTSGTAVVQANVEVVWRVSSGQLGANIADSSPDARQHIGSKVEQAGDVSARHDERMAFRHQEGIGQYEQVWRF